MRHYLWQDATGAIKGISRNVEGFSVGCDPTDSGTSNQEALDLRDFFLNKAGLGITNVIAFDCVCSQGNDACTHDTEALQENYIATGTLTSKPALTIKLDNISTPSSSTPLDYAPGTSISFKLEAAVADSYQTTLLVEGAAITADSLVLTFTSGVSNAITLVAPAQGLVGYIGCEDMYIRQGVIAIRGWA